MKDRETGQAHDDRCLLVGVEEAARRLSLSRAKTYRLMQAGELRSVQIGRARRIPLDALTEFVASLQRKEVSDSHSIMDR